MAEMSRFLTLRWLLRAAAALAGAGAAYAPPGGKVQAGSALVGAVLAGLSFDLPPAKTRKGARHRPAFPRDAAPAWIVLPFYALLAVGVPLVAACAHTDNLKPGDPVAVCPSAANLAKRITGTDVLDVENVIEMDAAEADCHETVHQDQSANEGAQQWARGFISQTFLRGYIGNGYEIAARAQCD